MFRDLRADEIECRVAQCSAKGVSLLLYKDARCDQNILDETVTPMGWMRHHCRDNANCIVSIWDEKKQIWIDKEDTGTESNTEKEKGLASDSFKRACFNWGIGRELYTAPFIWIRAEDCKDLKQNEKTSKWQCFDFFEVKDIIIENKRIVGLTIKNCKTNKVVYSMGKAPVEPKETNTFKKADIIKPEKDVCACCGKPITDIVRNGAVIKTASEVAAWSKDEFNESYCWTCAKKIMDSREGQ